MRDIVSEIGAFFTGITALQVLKTTQTSPSVDLQGYDGAMVYILAGNWTDGTMTPVVQDSDDNSTWGAAANADLVAWSATSTTDATAKSLGNVQPTAISSAATAINQRVGYIGAKRYIRLVSTISASPATGMGYDAIIVAGRPRKMPANV